jgi:gas vesicle protein
MGLALPSPYRNLMYPATYLNWYEKCKQSKKEKVMTNGNQVLTQDQPALQSTVVATTPEVDNRSTVKDQTLAKVAIGALVGATLGGLAGALANKSVVDRINRTIKELGNSLKKTTSNVNDTVQDVGDAVYTITANVTDTVRDVGETVKQTADSVNSTVRETVDTVRNTANDVNGTVRTTLNSVKDSAEEVLSTDESNTAVPDQDTLYKLVPVEPAE